MVKSSENFRFFRNFRKLSIRVKFSNNFDFGQNFRKISILVTFSKILVKLSKKNSILVKIFENFKNVDFSKIFVKFRFWSKFFEKFRFFLRKISILVKFLKNFDFGQNFEKLCFCSNFRKNFYFRQNCGKFLFWLNFPKISFFGQNFRKFRKISILVKFPTNIDLSQIFEKFGFGSKFSKHWDFFENSD